MCTEAETWLEVTYPELVEDWREAYLALLDPSEPAKKECRICSIRPNTGLHYGVHTCEADKQFLKRTFHERQAYKVCNLFCPPRLRGWCQYCRLRFSLRTGINLKMIRITKKKPSKQRKQRVKQKSASPPVRPKISPGAEMYNPFRPYLDNDPDPDMKPASASVPFLEQLPSYYNPLAFYQQQLSVNYWNQIQSQMQVSGLSFCGPPAVRVPNCEILSERSTSPCQVVPLDLSWSSSSSSSQTPSRPSSAGSYCSRTSPSDSQAGEMATSFNKLSVNSAVLQEALSMVHSTLSPGRFQDLSSVSDVLSE